MIADRNAVIRSRFSLHRLIGGLSSRDDFPEFEPLAQQWVRVLRDPRRTWADSSPIPAVAPQLFVGFTRFRVCPDELCPARLQNASGRFESMLETRLKLLRSQRHESSCDRGELGLPRRVGLIIAARFSLFGHALVSAREGGKSSLQCDRLPAPRRETTAEGRFDATSVQRVQWRFNGRSRIGEFRPEIRCSIRCECRGPPPCPRPLR